MLVLQLAGQHSTGPAGPKGPAVPVYTALAQVLGENTLRWHPQQQTTLQALQHMCTRLPLQETNTCQVGARWVAKTLASHMALHTSITQQRRHM